jgi:16S rRNA (cytosine1402-N4)-methyltransferase
MQNGPLDMRMDTELGLSAAQIIEQEDEKELAAIFRDYGEERHARRIARAIVEARQREPIVTTGDLVRVVQRVVPERFRVKTLARVFQALRISVNRELEALQAFLPQAFALLKLGGHLVVISYHSLEDRLVKRFMVEKTKDCICPPELPVCQCGHQAEGKLLTRKAISANQEEIHRNPRARSAKLRAIEKIAIQ